MFKTSKSSYRQLKIYKNYQYDKVNSNQSGCSLYFSKNDLAKTAETGLLGGTETKQINLKE